MLLKHFFFVSLRVLNLFTKSFVNPFVNIAVTFLIVHLIHFYLNLSVF